MFYMKHTEKTHESHPSLTYISSAESFAQWPWPNVGSLVVDGQALNAAHKATICACRPDQPVSSRRSTHIQRRAKSNLSVLTLKEQD